MIPLTRLVAVLCLAPLLSAAEKPGLRAGAAAVDITPRAFPLNMPGGHSANLARSAHDPLHSRALVLDDGSTKIALVVVDNLGVSPEVIAEARTMAAAQTDIATSTMLVSSTHTHSGPSSSPRTGATGEIRYLPIPAQHRLGGYESWLGTNVVQEDASVILTRNLLEMLAELQRSSG